MNLGGLVTKTRELSEEDKAAERPSLRREPSKLDADESSFESFEKFRNAVCKPSIVGLGETEMVLLDSKNENYNLNCIILFWLLNFLILLEFVPYFKIF